MKKSCKKVYYKKMLNIKGQCKNSPVQKYLLKNRVKKITLGLNGNLILEARGSLIQNRFYKLSVDVRFF